MPKSKKKKGFGPGTGLRDVKIGEEVRIAINLSLKKFVQTEDETELEFPSSFTSQERAYIHRLSVEMGLKSKSRGKGVSRALTVFKKEGSTIVSSDATLHLSGPVRRYAGGLLAKFPVTNRERSDLLPLAERERGSGGMIPSRDVAQAVRTMGKLSGGIPQVPSSWGGKEWLARRQDLPIWQKRQEILNSISSHQVILVTGDTGSGKTTQVPQFILEEAFEQQKPVRVICTEPRRIAAVTVAERVAAERDENMGQTVGYQIRLESCVSPKTLLTFCTNGVLLRTLMGGDGSMASLTHVVIDEIHERDKMSDFLLTVLRDLIARHRNLRLILMSATVDTELFLSYFPGCCHISVPGRMFPVQEYFLEDILLQTNYNSPEMKAARAEGLGHNKGLEDLTSRLSLDPDKTQETQENKKNELAKNNSDNDIENDVVVEETVAPDPEEVFSPDPEMDNLLSTCFLSEDAEDEFSTLLSMLEDDSPLLDYPHSATGVTILMLAAGRGRSDLLEAALQAGANCHSKATNGWTALDFARKTGQAEAASILEAHQAAIEDLSVSLNEVKEEEEVSKQLSQEQRDWLAIYHASWDDDRVDHALILHLLLTIYSQPPGAVLCFLPGYDDIITLRDLIAGHHTLGGPTVQVLTLHSQMASNDQKRAFQPARNGQRKIVLATNVAETSITLNDVVYVIDAGKVKEKSFDALTNVSMLKSTWISQTSATQRKGRAGRCQPGKVYRLFSSVRYGNLSKFQTPEILRTPLLELCLHTKLLAPPNTPIADFLARVLDPPSFLVTRNAVQALKTLEALDSWEDVTALGSHLLDLPLDPVLGKVLLHGVLLKCVDPILTIVCCLAYRDPFLLPVAAGAKKQAGMARKRLAGGSLSDHMALLRAFQCWQQARMEGSERAWCSRNMVSVSTMEMVVGMRTQVLGQLRASGFVRAKGTGDIRDINTNSDNWGVVKACLVAGMYPNIARLDREAGQLRTQKESKVRLHPSCVLVESKNKLPSLASDWLVYNEMTRVGRTAYVRGVSVVSQLAVVLFAGPSRLPATAVMEADTAAQVNCYMEESSDSEEDDHCGTCMLHLDDWISFRCEPDTSQEVLQLRQKWSSLWLRRLAQPGRQSRAQEDHDEAVIANVAAALQAEEMALGLGTPNGVGQRPKPMPADLSTGQPTSHVEPRRLSDTMSTTSEDSAYSHEGPLSPPPHLTPPPGATRYFIVKPSAGSLGALETSKHSGNWTFPPVTERRLVQAVASGNKVMVIFSVASSRAFQGCAVFTGQMSREGPRVGHKLEWLRCNPLPFSQVQHLNNSYNEDRRVQTARDGQEVEPGVGQLLLKAMEVMDWQGGGYNRRGGGADRFQPARGFGRGRGRGGGPRNNFR